MLVWKILLKERRAAVMRKRKGFTLIELLVVISIITLLMAILMATLQRVRNQARAVVCRAHLKQWGTVLALYVEDNEGRIPAKRFWEPIWFFRGSWVAEGDPNRPLVYHDLTTKGIACCPMAVDVGKSGFQLAWGDGFPFVENTWIVVTRQASTAFGAWQVVSPPPRFRGSYGFNRTGRDGPQTLRNVWDRKSGVETHLAKGHANIPVILEAPGPKPAASGPKTGPSGCDVSRIIE
jgi:prepilin-type N-terminal cleavage/methylation domain-containing protein